MGHNGIVLHNHEVYRGDVLTGGLNGTSLEGGRRKRRWRVRLQGGGVDVRGVPVGRHDERVDFARRGLIVHRRTDRRWKI